MAELELGGERDVVIHLPDAAMKNSFSMTLHFVECKDGASDCKVIGYF